MHPLEKAAAVFGFLCLIVFLAFVSTLASMGFEERFITPNTGGADRLLVIEHKVDDMGAAIERLEAFHAARDASLWDAVPITSTDRI